MPDFESNYIDAPLQLTGAHDSEDDTISTQPETVEVPAVEGDDVSIDMPAANSDWVRRDPTYRLSKLGPANQKVISVTPNGTLEEVVGILLLKNFSQLPVMTNEREVKGVITWASIGSRLALSRPPGSWARDFMEPHHEIRSTFSIFDAIPVVVHHQYVLVRGDDNRITGIITASDLSGQFRLLAEPFLLLGEIENLLRGLIADRFSASDLTDVRDPSDSARQIHGPDDLAFGEYQRLLEKPDRWKQFGLAIDRVSFCRDLDNIRRIRNDVMHFDPEGVLQVELDSLRDFKTFLGQVQSIISPRR
ncbi:CBS domain-containing protein [Bradyrhizobium sp.]|uniref:CBS domain-containing protein n=1 Tax=Bradyrhizobium sp. TaxID=376 RepID=UPI0025BE4212|nr:CBS domain-containing protein [Bradyrhizobium sp.]